MHEELKKIPILMYHSISDPKRAGRQFRPFTVSPALFAEHMKYLYEHGYTAITVTQLITLLSSDRRRLPQRPVVVTFDDGFADFFTDALPVLKRYNFVATVYIPTAFVGRTSTWLWREKEAIRPILTWSQISEMSRQGIECGGHSHTHSQLDLLPPSLARREITQNKELLEDHLGRTVSTFAYPYGYHSSAIQQMVKEAGYIGAFAVKYEMCVENANPFSLGRLLPTPNTGVNAFAALLNSSPPSLTTKLQKCFCTPAWRLIRYYSETPYSLPQKIRAL